MLKRALLYSFLTVAFALVLLIGTELPAPEEESHPAEGEQALSDGERGGELHSRTLGDGDMMLRVLREGNIEEMSMADYLPMALAGEMPASFQPEALKAQAVALRSYALYHKENPKSAHPEADICLASSCCAAAKSREEALEQWGAEGERLWEKILKAVEETDGQYLAAEQETVLAMFHSSSLGSTESGSALSTERSYLLSVSSPETTEQVKNLVSTVEVSADEFRDTVLRSFPGTEFSGEAEGWVGEVAPSAGGRVGSITVGSQEISGLTMRQLFSLRSTDFTLEWTGENFLFTVRGYGHGLGMSQYGANAMALEGCSYAGILSHYYPGAELVVAVEVLE